MDEKAIYKHVSDYVFANAPSSDPAAEAIYLGLNWSAENEARWLQETERCRQCNCWYGKEALNEDGDCSGCVSGIPYEGA